VSSAIESASSTAQVDEKLERSKQRSIPAGVGGAGSRGQTSDYLFVNNVRFLAMVSIVWVHSIGFGGGATRNSTLHLQLGAAQMMKFGTIGFFLISGYLLGEGLTRTGRTKYFYRRVKAVLVPWIFWSCVWFVFAIFLNPLIGGGLKFSLHELAQKYVKFVFFQSIYWFVPNFFLCLALILALYKRVPDYVQGAMFGACSLFYGVNVYLRVVPAEHTSALFGFVFYLWLGQMAYKYRDAWGRWLGNISWTRLSIYTGAAAMLTLAEIHVVRGLHTGEEFNTLRLSNQVFSVAVVMLIVKCKTALFPRAIDVRAETFGIFLIHPILLQIFIAVRDRVPDTTMSRIRGNGVVLISLGLATFGTIYLLSLLLTKVLRRVPYLKWTIGR
jgi:peptidoglycan/LPS O-acetylase OafA/YrhL